MNKTAEGSKLYRCGVEFSLPSHTQFIKDMEVKKHPVRLYNVYGYSGPCVRVPANSKTIIMGLTNVRCGAIQRGGAVIIFPYGHDPVVAATVKDQPWLNKSL